LRRNVKIRLVSMCATSERVVNASSAKSRRWLLSAENAQQLADRLAAHPAVAKVSYPGLGTVRNAHLVGSQMRGPGSLMAFHLHGGHAAASTVMAAVKLITPAVSLGSVDSLIQHPAGLTHRVLDEATQAQCGITPGLLRLSAGIEHVDDLWADLGQALDTIKLREAA
jgi:methionine-gamma-lyase